MQTSHDQRILLVESARRAHLNAYAPYSGFRVGAAVVGSDGHIYEGCNIENASYGLGVCAERVAIFKAVAAGCSGIVMLAVVCPDATELASGRMPCGACRQVMAEFGDPSMRVLVDGVGEFTLNDLQPRPFALPRPRGSIPG